MTLHSSMHHCITAVLLYYYSYHTVCMIACEYLQPTHTNYHIVFIQMETMNPKK